MEDKSKYFVVKQKAVPEVLLKVVEAKRLLEISDKSLEQIAAYLGFSSQSHFQNAFRKHTGITPGAYRSQRKMH